MKRIILIISLGILTSQAQPGNISLQATTGSGASLPANSAGVLTNNGSGTLGYLPLSSINGNGTGIATNNGAGNANILTNTTHVVTGNQSAQAIFTNYPSLDGAGHSMTLDFCFAGATNWPHITFGSGPGSDEYGQLFCNVGHGGGTNSTGCEMELDSGGSIALVTGFTINPSHIQKGGGAHSWEYMQTANGSDFTGTSDHLIYSSISTWRQGRSTNGANYVVNPGVRGFTTENGSEWAWNIGSFPDNPNGDSWTTNDFQNLPFLLTFGTNYPNNAFFWRTTLQGGMKGSTSNLLTIDTNCITVNGTLNDTNVASDVWYGPNVAYFGQNHGVAIQNNIIGIATQNGTGGDVFEVGNSAGGVANDYIRTGGGFGNGGTAFPNGGVTIGTNNTQAVAKLDVWGGIFTSNRISFPSNYVAASFGVVAGCISLVPSNSAIWMSSATGTNLISPYGPANIILNPIVSGGYWTNTNTFTGTLTVNVALLDSVSGDPGLNMTNIITGEWINATSSMATAGLIPSIGTFRMAPNDYFLATNFSSGTATASIKSSSFRP